MLTSKVYLLLFWTVLLLFDSSEAKKTKKPIPEKMDSLMHLQCELNCGDVPKENKTECRHHCKKNLVKQGQCPQPGDTEWEKACVETCTADFHCPDVQRCCKHDCGSICRTPTDLEQLPGLPAIPTIKSVQERKESTKVKWSDSVGDPARKVPGKILYILEYQHHIGAKFEPEKLGDWQELHRTPKSQVSIKKALLPGRWYRFRVASVSSLGSRGFSKPSEPFTLRRGPRAPAIPKRLRISKMAAEDDNITVTLRWRAPQSDLPIIRYKVFWSRRLRGIDGQLNSVLVNQMSVPKNEESLEISGLEPDSMYFLQVQAISQFGEVKLRSEKAAIFLNTTDYDNGTAKPSGHHHHHNRHKVSHFKLIKVIWHKNKLKARVAWTPTGPPHRRTKDDPLRYYIQWWTDACGNETQRPENRKHQLAATTAEDSFELYELNYGCKYTVHINQLPSRSNAPPDAVLNFEMPACHVFQAKVKNTSISCP